MKIIIIDDTQQAIDALTKKLALYPGIEVVGQANNGTDGLKLLKEKNPDVVFIDVEMPDMTGIDLLSRIKMEGFDNTLPVIYTAFDTYTLSALRNKAFDFLLKPIDDKELETIITRLEKEIACMKELPTDTEDNAKDATWNNGNALKKKGDKLLLYINAADFRLVEIQDICAFQYNHDLRVWEVVAVGYDNPIRLKRCANKDILMTLDENFVQVNQKYIINIKYLMGVNDNCCCFFPPFNNIDYIKIGRMYRRKLIERFNII